ncbi:MAG: hypothetical protein PUG67_05405 [Peptoniphilaceae bacterium]|nr:hypothetical protein [Peptoniphilaceae bacterium]MDY6019000.1 hypothetical protein [Anaerococcus sp.]
MIYIWPILATAGVIFLIDFITDNRKTSLRLSIVFALGAIAFIYLTGIEFIQLYLFLFLISISLVILALQKEIDSFTLIGILLMIVMLYILLKYPLL